jgi:PIN domain nuclease of toxin-antitoxin system
MRVLLDTHLLLWVLKEPSPKASTVLRRRIDNAEVFVSAASIWEISIKAALGKLKADPNEVLEAIEPAGFSMLAISGLHAAKVAELPPVHSDPFDRMLVAQALVEPMILLTNDRALAGYGTAVSVT